MKRDFVRLLNISHKSVTICAVIHINVTYLLLTSRPHWSSGLFEQTAVSLPLNKIRLLEATICWSIFKPAPHKRACQREIDPDLSPITLADFPRDILAMPRIIWCARTCPQVSTR